MLRYGEDRTSRRRIKIKTPTIGYNILLKETRDWRIGSIKSSVDLEIHTGITYCLIRKEEAKELARILNYFASTGRLPMFKAAYPEELTT